MLSVSAEANPAFRDVICFIRFTINTSPMSDIFSCQAKAKVEGQCVLAVTQHVTT